MSFAWVKSRRCPSPTVDEILSNCVINLSPDKAAVFREALRVLKAGGAKACCEPSCCEPEA